MSFENPAALELAQFKDRRRRRQVERKAKVNSSEAPEAIGPLAPYSLGPCLPELDGMIVQAQCTEFVPPRVSRRFGKNSAPTAYAKFTILDGETAAGEELFCAYSMPKNDGRPSAANKFARHWCIANEGPPRRKGPRERMAYKRFLGSIFEVELRLVTEGARGQKLAPENQYLVVHNIVSLVARGEKSR